MIAALQIGSVSSWLTVAAVIGLAVVFSRGGTGTAVKGLTDTNGELERQIKERDGKISALERINAELRAQKDVGTAIEPVIAALHAHEERAQERAAKVLVVLDLIADRLGPDMNGGHT